MKVILLKDVAKIGKKYDIKDVADGYALNLLIPKNIAIIATKDAVKNIETIKTKEEGEKKVQAELLAKNLDSINGKTITLTEKANEKGHLFAGVHKLELLPSIEKECGVNILPEHILMDKPIKEIGIHEITIRAGGKEAKLKVNVVAK
jgi:large subunit ribosomal protein L9